jgi:aminocarboxymuconate-semialdehyde decarboxylase
MTPAVVDAHSHLYPPAYIDLLRKRSEPPRITGEPGRERFVLFDHEQRSGGGRPIDSTYWDLDEKLAFMTRHGIDQSVISLGNPWLDPIPPNAAHSLAHILNAELAKLETQTGGRLCALGVLPSGAVHASVEAVRDVARTPGLHGVVMSLRPCGMRLDDPMLDPLWQQLEESRVPAFIHPHYGAAMDDLTGFGHSLPVGVAFPVETTVAVARLVFAGVLVRFPDLALMVAHGGGTLPYLAGRLDAAWRSDASTHARLPHPPSIDLAKLALDAVLYRAAPMRGAADLVGAARLMFGTDHPFSVAEPLVNRQAVDAAFMAADVADVVGRAARSFFRLPDIEDGHLVGRKASGES